MTRRLSLLSAFILAMFTSLVAQSAMAGGWEMMGEKQVSRRAETDTILVGSRQGALEQIQFRVRGADVDFRRVVVHYKNGQTREIQLKSTIDRGGKSRVIDLPGKARMIERVSFWYKTKGAGKSQATVLLWGKTV